LTDLLFSVACFLLLAPILVITPYLFIRAFSPRADATFSIALSGVLSLVLNASAPVALHILSIPVTRPSLALVHSALGIMAIGAFLLRRPSLFPRVLPTESTLILLVLLLAVLVFPFTHLAGIDTYKWQDLASNVAVQRSVPWLMHAASLLGFTPRSYPSLQPLALATVQIVGGLGVDAGYYLVSVFNAVLGVAAAALLARRLFSAPSSRIMFTVFYALSPVFMRYSHWATGRGFFLSLFPLFLLAVLDLPRALALPSLCLMAILLAAAHKAGLVAVALAVLCVPASLVLPRRDNRWILCLVCLPFVALAVAVAAGPGSSMVAKGFAFLRADLTRFGWFVPAAIAGLLGGNQWFGSRERRRLLPLGLVAFAASHIGDMYGALIALVFVCIAATDGTEWIVSRIPKQGTRIRIAAGILTLAGAVLIIAVRSAQATPRRIYAAAVFLEEHDPDGPFVLDAPGMARSQIQGYVSGCPRFRLIAHGPVRVRFNKPPAMRGDPVRIVRKSIGWLRHLMVVTGVRAMLYGEAPVIYRVRVDRRGPPPRGHELLFSENGVEVFGPMVAR